MFTYHSTAVQYCTEDVDVSWRSDTKCNLKSHVLCMTPVLSIKCVTLPHSGLLPRSRWVYMCVRFRIADLMNINMASSLFQNRAYPVTSARFGWAVARVDWLSKNRDHVKDQCYQDLPSTYSAIFLILHFFPICLHIPCHDVTRNSSEIYNA